MRFAALELDQSSNLNRSYEGGVRCNLRTKWKEYRNHAKVRTPVLAFFYSVFLHNQEGANTN